VQDLLALGRFLLLPEDDLSLAAVLKSPLFDLSEDDIFEVAALRGDNEIVSRPTSAPIEWEIRRARIAAGALSGVASKGAVQSSSFTTA
ncbi:hypothetical protein ACC839_38340, partial [Rhizobium ruizarguesonis]